MATTTLRQYKTQLLQGDLSFEDKHWIEDNCDIIAVDTETTGLNPIESSLELIQLFCKNRVYLLKFSKNTHYENLTELLNNKDLKKVFHHATFDVKFLFKNLPFLELENIVCTKVAAKLLFGINEKNSLKSLLARHLGIFISKEEQTSDWTATTYNQAQIDYAINDVIYLPLLWEKLQQQLSLENKLNIANQCFIFLPTQAKLELKGIKNIFSY